jgi:hypothetical protein
MQQQSHLIGHKRTATGAVGGKLDLVQLDQVLRLAADVGDDIASIETLPCGLDACGDAARP